MATFGFGIQNCKGHDMFAQVVKFFWTVLSTVICQYWTSTSSIVTVSRAQKFFRGLFNTDARKFSILIKKILWKKERFHSAGYRAQDLPIASVAQIIKHSIGNRKVLGSIPSRMEAFLFSQEFFSKYIENSI